MANKKERNIFKSGPTLRRETAAGGRKSQGATGARNKRIFLNYLSGGAFLSVPAPIKKIQ